MTISHDFDERLTFDQADRMRRALRVSDISVGDMAAYLQVSRNTVTAWINGRNEPRRRDLAAFALRTGFPVSWLQTGEMPPEGSPDGGAAGSVIRHYPKTRHLRRAALAA